MKGTARCARFSTIRASCSGRSTTRNRCLGRPLNDVLTWDGPTGAAGCYCELNDRLHKWRLVLETIHYALVQRESEQLALDN